MSLMIPEFHCSSKPVLVPQPGCPWADTMVLNPAMIQDPKSGRLHMLFRATGPWPEKRLPDREMPYPIFLGYAYSDDRGETWHADFSRPALSPAMQYEEDKISVLNLYHEKVVDYSNGCIEDPRLFWLEGDLYLTVACRMFAVGAYWEGKPMDQWKDTRPDWAIRGETTLGRAAKDDVTVTVLYRVHLPSLKSGDYEKAFDYVTHLTDPEMGENRDAFLFSEKMFVRGKEQYVLIHRPMEGGNFIESASDRPPSIFVAVAENLKDFSADHVEHQLLASPVFPWEGNRIGGSMPPIKIDKDQWLLGYHGKQDDAVGYTQSFMILQQEGDEFPKVRHRCPDRLMYAKQSWEFSRLFKTPCVFSCSGVVVDETLIIGYGAGDECVGIARVSFNDLVSWVRQYDETGKKTGFESRTNEGTFISG